MDDRSPNPTVTQQFEFDRVLTRAGERSSWLVEGKEDGRRYVLKYLPSRQIDSVEKLTERLKRLCQRLHPGLVRPYGWAPGEGHIALWRPHIEGVDSGSLVRAPLDRILAVAQRVAEALHSAHAAGLTHGALKAGNVILDDSRGVFVVDFAPQPRAGVKADIPAFGELLYFWLTGANCLRDGDDQALAGRFRQQLRAELQVPPQLGGLLLGMLAAAESQRPRTLLSVRDHIDDVRLLLAGNRLHTFREEWSEAPFIPLKAPESAAPMGPGAPPLSGRRSFSTVAFAIVLAALLVAIFTVVKVLPERIEGERPIASQPLSGNSVDPPAAPVVPPPLSPEQLEAMLRLREEAQATLDALINVQLELQEQQVEQWGERRFAAALAQGREGDEPFRRQDFEAAAGIYAAGLAALRKVAALRPLIVAEALERGAVALSAVDSQSAAEAFSLALAIEPDNELAEQGLKRATTLDEVVALLVQAEAAEQAGELQAAHDFYAQVLELDAATSGIEPALARVRSALTERAFRAAMSKALAALEGGDWPAARTAFRQAGNIRPGARAVADGLIELERRVRDNSIAAMGERAATAVSQERWEAAGKHYAQMLEKDPNLLAAQEGRRLAGERLDLDQRLDSFLTQPSNWWSDAGRSEAASLLYDARATASPGPRLRDKVGRLDRQLELAGRPVEVTLISDESCDVVVYKIARLGQFQSTRLRLLPGRYTAVGTRDGYRDVRRDFLVAAGANPEPVALRCQDQVFAGR